MTTPKNPYAGPVIRAAWDEEEQANQGRVEPEAVIRRAKEMLPDATAEALRDAAVRVAFEQEDERRRDVASSLQLDLFSGNFEALNGAIPTANGGRVGLLYALMEDWIVWIDLSQQHLDRVNKRHSDKIRNFTQLAPYLNVAGTTTKQAIEKFQQRSGRTGP